MNPAVAVYGGNLYFTDGVVGAVMTVPLSGGTPTVIASGQQGAGAIAVDGTNVYWGSNGGLMQLPLAGGVPMALASGAKGPIAVDATSVYFVTGETVDAGTVDAVAKVPIGGGASTVMISLPEASMAVFAIAVDAQNVYLVAGGGPDNDGGVLDRGDIISVPKVSGPPQTLASGPNVSSPFAIDATHAYYWQNDCLKEVPLGGGAATCLSGPSLSGPSVTSATFVVDGTNIYWSAAGSVMKVPLAGGTPTTIGSIAGTLVSLVAVDGTSVYSVTTDRQMSRYSIDSSPRTDVP